MAIDINAFAKSGVLAGSGVSGIVRAGEHSLAFSVEHGDGDAVRVRFACAVSMGEARHTLRTTVPVVRTRQRIGEHAWWACPRCRRRTRIVYLPPVGQELGCRVCLGLMHRSAQEHVGRFKMKPGVEETQASVR